jgi:hypothetical protein
MTPDVLQRIIDLVNEGKTLRQALSIKGMPCPATVRKYRKNNPRFERQLAGARSRVNTRELQSKSRIANSEKRYLARFPEFILRIEDGQGARAIFSEMRFGERSFGAFLKRNPAQRRQLVELRAKRQGKSRRFAPEHYDQALALFAAAISTPAYGFKADSLPGYNAMVARCANHQEFAEAFAIARRERISKRCETAEIARKQKAVKRGRARTKLRPTYQTAVLRGQLLQDELYRAADAAVGRGLPEHTRDDVKADLIEAVLLKSFPIEEMAEHAAAFVTAHDRRMETYRSASLDQTLSGDSDMTFLDRLTTDAYGYAD